MSLDLYGFKSQVVSLLLELWTSVGLHVSSSKTVLKVSKLVKDGNLFHRVDTVGNIFTNQSQKGPKPKRPTVQKGPKPKKPTVQKGPVQKGPIYEMLILRVCVIDGSDDMIL